MTINKKFNDRAYKELLDLFYELKYNHNINLKDKLEDRVDITYVLMRLNEIIMKF